ncbi:MAG: hypothetical protein ACI9SC_002615 [Gammaproteobacteria bacterium]|jgi:hypothetical protein
MTSTPLTLRSGRQYLTVGVRIPEAAGDNILSA